MALPRKSLLPYSSLEQEFMSKFKIRVLCAAFAAGLAGSLVAAPAFAADKSERVIVKFKAGAFAKGRAELAARGGKTVLNLSEFNAVAARLSPAAIKLLKKSSLVEFIEPDYQQHTMAVSEVVPYGIPMVQADQLSDAGTSGLTLCIVDSGIDGSHPDHAGNKLAGENFTTSGAWNTDENGHGTHVAGTVAAVGGNGMGVVGVLPNKNINLYIAKVFDASGSAPSSTIAKAMWACSKNGNANVISMSLGGSGASKLQGLVAKLLARRGVMMFAAAGNNGTSSISYPAGFPEVISVAAVDAAKAHADFSQFNATVEIAAPGVLTLSTVPQGTALVATTTVGASGYESLAMEGSPSSPASAALYDFGTGEADDAGVAGKVCLIQRGNISFSDKVLRCQANGGVGAIVYNNEPALFAGTLGGVATAIPSVSVSGTDGATMLTQLGQTASMSFAIGDYDFFSGTSMATPHASAVGALVWGNHPSCTAEEIRASLNKSAEDLGAVGRDDEFGNGLIQAKAASDRITSMGCGN